MAKESPSSSNISPTKDKLIFNDINQQKKLQTGKCQDKTIKDKLIEADQKPVEEETVFNNIRNCDLDPRGYRGVILKNKLKVILISDPQTDLSAASLVVSIGSSSDPEEIQGLAHFLEHMLFLGTEKYPNKDDYSSFISKHSGSKNAVTSEYHTNYHFSIDPTYFEDALDRFVQFFISPLFDFSSMDKELNIIQSEFEQDLDNDIEKSYYIDKETCDQTHEYHKFICGNKRTLKDEPKSRGINLREEMLKFYSENYSSNVMSLCVLGKQSLDELYEMVCKRLPFSEIKNTNVKIKVSNRSPFLQEHIQKEIKIVPHKDNKSLQINFKTNYDINDNYVSKCKSYIARLINYGSEGSLTSELKKNGLIYCLSSTGKRINISLTELGLEKVDEVIKTVIQYLNLIKKDGVQKRFLDEHNKLGEIRFETKETHRGENPLSYVISIAHKMQRYHIKEVVNHSLFLTEFKPEKIDKFISQLKPENIRISIMAHKFKGQTDRKEKYYSIDYSIQDISEDRLNLWKTAGLNANLQLPKPNEFLPKNLTLVERDEEQNEHPVLIKQDKFSNIWYLQDNEYKTPKSFYYIQIFNPFFHLDPKYYVCMVIYRLLIYDSLQEHSYQSKIAGLNYSISVTDFGISIQTSGYSEKLHLILGKLVDKLINFEFDRNRFGELKEYARLFYTEYKKSRLYNGLFENQSELLYAFRLSTEDLLNSSAEVTFEEIENVSKLFFSKIAFDIFIDGNVTKKDVDLVEELTKNRLIRHYKSNPLPRYYIPYYRKRVVKLEDNSFYIHCEESEYHQTNAILNYYQFGLVSPIEYTKNDLMVNILKDKAFHQLRTEKQLGFFVRLLSLNFRKVHGIYLLIESSLHPQHLDNCIEMFIDWCKDYVNNLTDEEFNSHKESLRVLRSEPIKLLHSRSWKYWYQILTNECDFDERKTNLEVLDEINKQDIIDLFNKHLVKNKRKLSLRIIGKKKSSNESSSIKSLIDGLLNEIEFNENESVNTIQNLISDLIDKVVLNELPKDAKLIENEIEFKESLFLYPHVKSKYAVY